MSQSKPDTQRARPAALAELPEPVKSVLRAAQAKKAADLLVLDLRRIGAFTDYFILCSGQSQRQVQAIADAVADAMVHARIAPIHVEGYERAEWILLDGFDFVVHVFTAATRAFYALERLWGHAERIAVPEQAPF
jgi:ribosome-associated protein